MERNQIICGDNCDELGKMPRECVDLVVTSPPYDDLRTYGGHSWDFYGVAWQLKRVLKPGGVIVWVVADATKDGSETGTSFEQALHFKRLGLNLHDTMVWNKGSFSAVGSMAVRYGPVFEYMFVFSDGLPKTFNPLIDRPNKCAGAIITGTVRNSDGSVKAKSTIGNMVKDIGQRFNVWDIYPKRDNRADDHPAPFPEALARDHILSWSNEGDLVLDPFNGSGTTTKMARELGRDYIGIDVNEAYCEIARKRISQQLLTFGETA